MRGFAVLVVYNFILVVKAHLAGVYQPHGSFPHQNCLAMAMHLFANLFFAYYLAVGLRGSKLSALAFVCATACIVRTYSRGAIAMMPLAFFVTFALSAFVSLKVPATRLASRVLPIVLVGFVGLAAMLPRVISRFVSAPEASGNTRIELALCAKEMILDEPWCGVGINNWGIKINPPYEYAELAGRYTNRGEDFRDGIVETVYLLVGAECGIPALLAMLLWFGHYLLLSISLARRLAGTPYAAISAGIAGGLVAIYIQSCLEWVLRQQMNLILLMMFFALLDHIKANTHRLAQQEKELETVK
jgi:O-antigen ligase